MDPITKKFLGEDLSHNERLFLKSMSQHEGFPILQKLFEQACKAVNEDVMKADPEAQNYDQILKARQQRARAINEFCEAIRKSFLGNVYVADQQIEKEKKTNERANNSAN